MSNRRPSSYPVIFQLFASRTATATIDALYGAIVAQARLPGFYLTYEVPDTVEGRFDMIVLHLVLLFRRLAREPESVPALAQGVFDRFCRDMDHNLREMGVGDLSVPKECVAWGRRFTAAPKSTSGQSAHRIEVAICWQRPSREMSSPSRD